MLQLFLTLDIIWNQAGASDDYVPHLEVREGDNFFPSRHCDMKQCVQEVGVIGEDVLKDKYDLCGLKVKNSWFQENEEVTALGLGLDCWSDMHPSSTEEIGWDTIWTEKSNDVTDATNFNLIQGEADLFGNGNEDRASHSFLGFSCANVSNFDDLDTSFRNDDSIIGHEMIGSADELWPSSVVAKGINNSLTQSYSTAASSLSSYFEETRSTTKWHNGKTECVPSKNQPLNLEMDKINNLISGSPHEVSLTKDEGAEFVNQTEASIETTAETTATQLPQSNKIAGSSCNHALEKKSSAGRKGQQENQHWQDDSIKTSMLIDGSSFAQSVFDQLQAAIKLDYRTRLCIRDSLFRLANGAVQRHSFCSTNRTNNIGKDRIDGIAGEEGNNHDRLTRLSESETDTNPIDRIMVHLLYCMPTDPSVTHRCPEFPMPGSHKEVPIQPKTENYVGPGPLSQPESSSVKQSIG